MKVLAYERALDLEMGELKRYALIETAQGKKKWKSLLVVLLIKIISIRQP